MELLLVDTRQIIEKMVTKDPTISAAEIAREAGVSRERVRQLLNEMGYELHQVWKKTKRKKG